MKYSQLNNRQKAYVNAFCKNKGISTSQALGLAIVKIVLSEMADRG